MNRKFRRLRVVIVSVLCASQLFGCAFRSSVNEKNNIEVTPMEKEESYAVSYDFIGGKDVMPIGAFYGPYVNYVSENGNVLPNYLDEKYFQMIAEAGINVIDYADLSYSAYPDLVMHSLDMCEKYGMGYFVYDSRVSNQEGKEENTVVNATELSEQIAKYSDHPAFCGVFLLDEPQTPYFMEMDGGRKDISRIGELSNILQHELDLNVYLNAFPVINIDTYKEKYEQYIAEYCEILKPKRLQYDHYPFYPDKNNEKLYGYFWNLSITREYAQKYKIPLVVAIQAGSQFNDAAVPFTSNTPYYPTEGQFYWNINTSLAFGAQGITYFPLIQPQHFGLAEDTKYDSERNGLIGVLGNKTQWYNYAQIINKHISVIDEVLMNSVNKGVIIHGEEIKEDMKMTNCVIESGSFQELMSVDGDAMVGCFNYKGKTALYVVNYSMDHKQKITLRFNDMHNITMMQNAETSYVKAKNLTLDMTAGEGVLLVIE